MEREWPWSEGFEQSLPGSGRYNPRKDLRDVRERVVKRRCQALSLRISSANTHSTVDFKVPVNAGHADGFRAGCGLAAALEQIFLNPAEWCPHIVRAVFKAPYR
jgi:hypothetical protein